MARLWTAGAELQTATAAIEFSSIITTAPVIETTIKRSGNAAYRISNVAAVEGFRNIHTASQGAFFFRFYLYITALSLTATRVIGGARITGSNKLTIRLTTGGALQLYNSEDSAQVGSDSAALSTATWYRIEMTYDSTTLASTTCSARIDGTQFASGTVDLAATPTNFGCFIDAADATLDYIVDDLAINDSTTSFQNSWPGEGEVIAQRPNGNGDNSAWTGSDGNSTDNYLLVDEVPPDSADYVQSNTSGQIDDYELEATPAAMESSDVINVVHVGVYAAVSDATSADPDIVLRIKASSGGTVEESASLDLNSLTYNGPYPLPAVDGNYRLTLYDLPGSSTGTWTKADLDTAQAGVREAVTDTHFARVAALWVMVDHKPGSAVTTISASDTESISVSETSALQVGVSPADTETLSITEGTSDVVVSLNRSDTLSLSLTESSSNAISVNPNDTLSVSLTDTSQVVASVSPSDALDLSISESASVVISNSIETLDTLSLSLTETSAVQVSVNPSDILSISLTESSTSQLSVNPSDTEDISLTESTAVVVSVNPSDALELSITESSSLIISNAVSVSDTLSISLTESSASQLSVNPDDTISLSLTETISLAVEVSPSDTLSLSISESASIIVSISTSDTFGLSLSESSSLLISNAVSVLDTLSISLTELSSVVVSASPTDAISLSLTETTSLSVNISPTDTLSLSLSESVAVVVSVSVSDTFNISLTESSSVFASSDTVIVAASDILNLSLSESSSLLISNAVNTSDTLNLSLTEAPSVVVSVSLNDSVSISFAESIASAGSTNPSDLQNISLGETTSLLVTVSVTDIASLSLTESASITISVVASVSDTLDISITETSSLVITTPAIYIVTQGDVIVGDVGLYGSVLSDSQPYAVSMLDYTVSIPVWDEQLFAVSLEDDVVYNILVGDT